MSRKILLFAHTGRPEATAAATQACVRLHEAGLTPVMSRTDLQILRGTEAEAVGVQVINDNVPLDDIELGVVLGGDGSILRAAEIIRHTNIPLIGVNLGHVGFLAESERSDLDETVDHIVNRSYTVEERMAIDILVWNSGHILNHTWALNEASVEKGNREKMVEVVIEVDGRPLSTFGCDGVVMATPTGSTAYAFSGGGPIVWPEVEAMLMVPLSAHALFSRPMVTAPTSTMAVEILPTNGHFGVLWCDGRRTTELPPGSRIEVRRSDKPVRLARIHPAPFSERLVRKFDLPTRGWRGPVDRMDVAERNLPDTEGTEQP
ncbi:NAD kinase [uncultured Kocuria sp.]|uniref:NAD kinase n=1 Tax=uncultured Kocuria sp. TaxID=259305 RepID=UPI00259513C4|nr:NAD kinase [uncultured Kocuria sp.]MCT1367841.1 NAD kinase [Rothia sp. p3-SID1597]